MWDCCALLFGLQTSNNYTVVQKLFVFSLNCRGKAWLLLFFFAHRLSDVSIRQLFSNRKSMGGFDLIEMNSLMEHYNIKYSDFKLK
jgi:hypothetical protein